MKNTIKNIILVLLTIAFSYFLFLPEEQKPVFQSVGLETLGQQEMLGQQDNFSSMKLEGWGSAWYTQPEYDGDDMPADALVEATNIDFDIKKSIAPRLGSKILGTSSNNKNPINSLYTANSLDGRELMIRSHSTVLEWWNPDAGAWEQFASGFTSGKDFTFVDGMESTDTAVYTYYANGVDSIGRFRVAFGSLATTTGATTTLNSVDGFDSADDIGFDTTGTVTINNINYSYTGISGWSLTGMSGVPTSLSANEGVISATSTAGFTDDPTSAVALVIKDQRLYVAYQNSVFCSKIDDFQDFSYSSPRVASEGEVVIFPEGGKKINGLAVRPAYVAVFKDDYVGSLTFKDYSTDLSDIATIQTVARENNIGAVNQKSIINKNFSVIFGNGDIGLAELTRLESKDYDETIALAERLRNSIEDYDFSDTAIGIVDNKILLAVNDNSNFNNKVIVYNYLYQRFTEFTGWNIESFTEYNGNLYFGDAINQNVYQAFAEDYDDNLLSYITSAKTKWFNFGYPDQWKELSYVYVEGWVNKNTEIDFTIYFDEGGKYTSKTQTIIGTGDYVTALPNSGFGTNPFGLTNFSNVSESLDNLQHFGGYIDTYDLLDNKFRNVQFGMTTSGVGQNYRITRIIPYVQILDKEWCMDYPFCTINK